MNRMLRRLLTRENLVAISMVIAALAAVTFAGCGGKSGLQLDAPKNAGTAQALAGTSWTEPTSNVTYTFKDETNLEVTDPKLPDGQWGTFAVNNGILDLTLGLKTLNGTWDGTALEVEGKKLVKNEQA